jgi:hypothetical protein
MRINSGPRRNKTAKALLNIYEAKDILKEDQELFQKTLSDLKSRADLISQKKKEKVPGPTDREFRDRDVFCTKSDACDFDDLFFGKRYE